MGVPSYWASSYRFLKFTTPDVQDVIDAFRLCAVLQGSPAWTEPQGGQFVSPVDSSGRYMRLTFIRVSASQLQMNVKDPANANVITARMNISASSGSWIEIYVGQFHAFIGALYSSYTMEHLHAGIVDLSPLDQAYVPFYVFGHGTRDASGNQQYYSGWNAAATADGAGVVQRVRALGAYLMMDGSVPVRPVYMMNRGLDGSYYHLGTLYQAAVVGCVAQPGTELQVAIAPGVLGTFRVPPATGISSNGQKLAYRIG